MFQAPQWSPKHLLKLDCRGSAPLKVWSLLHENGPLGGFHASVAGRGQAGSPQVCIDPLVSSGCDVCPSQHLREEHYVGGVYTEECFVQCVFAGRALSRPYAAQPGPVPHSRPAWTLTSDECLLPRAGKSAVKTSTVRPGKGHRSSLRIHLMSGARSSPQHPADPSGDRGPHNASVRTTSGLIALWFGVPRKAMTSARTPRNVRKVTTLPNLYIQHYIS